VTVVDARGSLVGWMATVAPATLPPGADLLVWPGSPDVVAGNDGEVRSASVGSAEPASPAALMWAPAEGGGGTFTVDATVDLTIPDAVEDAVSLVFTIAVN